MGAQYNNLHMATVGMSLPQTDKEKIKRNRGGGGMSQTKYPLPDDIKRTAIEMVRGYSRRVSIYAEARYSILSGQSCNYVTYTTIRTRKDGSQRVERCRQYFSHGSQISDPTADKAARLEALDEHIETLRMRATENAKLHIGLDIVDEEERAKLTAAIWDSCIDGRNFIFSWRNLCVSRSNFYERRRKFLYEIAKETGFYENGGLCNEKM